MPIRVALGEDSLIVREGLCRLLALDAAAGGDERFDHFGVDHGAAGGDGVDGGHQLGAVVDAFLEQVGAAVGAVVEQRERVAGVGELAEDHDADLRMGPAQFGGEADALIGVGRRHADVGQHDVGPLLLAGPAERQLVTDRRDDLHLRVDGEQLTHAFAHDQAVLAQRNAGRHACSLTSPIEHRAIGGEEWCVPLY